MLVRKSIAVTSKRTSETIFYRVQDFIDTYNGYGYAERNGWMNDKNAHKLFLLNPTETQESVYLKASFKVNFN